MHTQCTRPIEANRANADAIRTIVTVSTIRAVCTRKTGSTIGAGLAGRTREVAGDDRGAIRERNGQGTVAIVGDRRNADPILAIGAIGPVRTSGSGLNGLNRLVELDQIFLERDPVHRNRFRVKLGFIDGQHFEDVGRVNQIVPVAVGVEGVFHRLGGSGPQHKKGAQENAPVLGIHEGHGQVD